MKKRKKDVSKIIEEEGINKKKFFIPRYEESPWQKRDKYTKRVSSHEEPIKVRDRMNGDSGKGRRPRYLMVQNKKS